jgi:hypothetical protein
MRESRLEEVILSEREKTLIANLRKAHISVISDRPPVISHLGVEKTFSITDFELTPAQMTQRELRRRAASETIRPSKK